MSGAIPYIYIMVQLLKSEGIGFELDTSQSGLGMFFRDWQIRILGYLWGTQLNGTTSGMVWSHLQETMDEPVSKASVINYLKDMAENGVLREDKEPGKGGYYGVYYQKYTESEFKQHIAEYVIRKLLKEFPGETHKIIEVTR